MERTQCFLLEFRSTYCLYARDASGRVVREQLLVKIGEGRDEVTWDERVEWEGW